MEHLYRMRFKDQCKDWRVVGVSKNAKISGGGYFYFLTHTEMLVLAKNAIEARFIVRELAKKFLK